MFQQVEHGKPTPVFIFVNIYSLDFKAPYTATAIELLEKAGVIMGGKINMDEFGMG